MKVANRELYKENRPFFSLVNYLSFFFSFYCGASINRALDREIILKNYYLDNYGLFETIKGKMAVYSLDYRIRDRFMLRRGI